MQIVTYESYPHILSRTNNDFRIHNILNIHMELSKKTCFETKPINKRLIVENFLIYGCLKEEFYHFKRPKPENLLCGVS